MNVIFRGFKLPREIQLLSLYKIRNKKRQNCEVKFQDQSFTDKRQQPLFQMLPHGPASQPLCKAHAIWIELMSVYVVHPRLD